MKKTIIMVVALAIAFAMSGCVQDTNWQPGTPIVESADVVAPSISPSGTTTYIAEQVVTISSAVQLTENSGGYVVYTDDKSDPVCMTSRLYSGQFKVTKSVIVKARYCVGNKMSSVDKAAYLSVL